MSCGRLPGVHVSMGEHEMAWARDSEAAFFQEDPSPADFSFLDEDNIWNTADGEEISYHELTDWHLRNIINWLRRNISEVYSGHWPSGEQAGYALEDSLSEAEGALEELEAERDSRTSHLGKGIHQAGRVGYRS